MLISRVRSRFLLLTNIVVALPMIEATAMVARIDALMTDVVVSFGASIHDDSAVVFNVVVKLASIG